MSNRYAIVEEPDALEVVDDDDGVYHPDQSISDRGASIRSLEPIISGPIGLKTIFYDPRWSPNQRKCCLGVMGVVVIACLSILISLFVGLGKVLNHIAEHEALKETGLYMIPDLELLNSATFFYLHTNSTPSTYQAKYIQDLNKTYQAYDKKYQTGEQWVDCEKGGDNSKDHLCKFANDKWDETPCRPSNNFGYNTNTPCVLFVFRKSGDWLPKVRNESNGIGIKCSPYKKKRDLKVRYYPKEGFPKYLFPEVESEENGHRSINPAVMVSFENLDQNRNDGFQIKCQIDTETMKPESLEKFRGTKEFIFQYTSGNPNFEI